MKSASQMSMEIRRKKKEMQDNPAVVDLSGIPMDKTDEDTMEANEMTSDLGLDTNKPMTHHMDLMADSHARKAELEQPNPKQINMAKGGMVEGMKDLHEAEMGEGGSDLAKQKRLMRLKKNMVK